MGRSFVDPVSEPSQVHRSGWLTAPLSAALGARSSDCLGRRDGGALPLPGAAPVVQLMGTAGSVLYGQLFSHRLEWRERRLSAAAVGGFRWPPSLGVSDRRRGRSPDGQIWPPSPRPAGRTVVRCYCSGLLASCCFERYALRCVRRGCSAIQRACPPLFWPSVLWGAQQGTASEAGEVVVLGRCAGSLLDSGFGWPVGVPFGLSPGREVHARLQTSYSAAGRYVALSACAIGDDGGAPGSASMRLAIGATIVLQ